jgi:hypothetical protein
MWGLVASMMVRVGACVTSSGPVWVWDRVFEGQSTFQIVAHKVREGKKKKREIKQRKIKIALFSANRLDRFFALF